MLHAWFVREVAIGVRGGSGGMQAVAADEDNRGTLMPLCIYDVHTVHNPGANTMLK
jgi:hypothetical protein